MQHHQAHDAALRALGIVGGRLSPPAAPVSSLPQLTHARELLALQRRFGTVRGDRVQGRHWRDDKQLHVHDDVELRVVIDGRLRFTVQGWGADDLRIIDCGPGDWLALPAGLPHSARLLSEGVDLLRLFSRHGGWRAHVPGTPGTPRTRPQPLAA